MLADEEHGQRRQITALQQQQQDQQQHVSAINATQTSISCPAGCLPPPILTEHHHHHHRYGQPSDKSQLDVQQQQQAAQQQQQQEQRFNAVAVERFGSERSNSDRLPSGERYQGVSERYPLGERPQTSVSSERLLSKEILQTSGHCSNDTRQTFQPERYNYGDRGGCHQQPSRYTPDRYTPIQNVGSLDRYHHHHHHHHHSGTMDRYSRTSTPTERYHTMSVAEKEQKLESLVSDRYTPTERHRNTTGASSKENMYKVREKRYGFEQYIGSTEHRFPPIPCPERFATQQERNSSGGGGLSFNQMQSASYMEPPSPAPTNDRFIPPPPLSPDDDDDVRTPNSDCFQNNAFPSPTTTVSTSDRFIPPPPLSPSPTEQTYSPPSSKLDQQRYHHHHHHHHQADKRYGGDRYHLQQETQRYKDRNYYLGGGQQEQRYIPPNAHMPVERYVPQQQQEPYYGTGSSTSSSGSYQYDRYGNSKFCASQNGDPYMRRDLAYHFRVPQQQTVQQQQQQSQQRVRYQNVVGTPNRIKCCQYQENTYQLVKSSPSSTTSSNSSVTSQQQQQQQQKEQCQNYQQQEKGIQCNNIQCGGGKECTNGTVVVGTSNGGGGGGGFVSPNYRNIKQGCRHSICASPSVEYVGASGGRHVCATPPPPRGSICSMDSSSLCCNENCCNTTTRRSQTSLQVAVWRSSGHQTVAQQQQQIATQQQQQQQQHVPPQQNEQNQQQQMRSATPTVSSSNTSQQQDDIEELAGQNVDVSLDSPPLRGPGGVQRAISLPAPSPSPKRAINYSQSERTPNRPQLLRTQSRKEMIKNYLKRETANFFGVDEENEDEQQIRWLDRRKRMATRTLGPLKEEYRSGTLPASGGGRSHWRTHSELVPSSMSRQLERPDVLPGPSDLPDSSIINQDRMQQHQQPEVTVRRKDSVARMTWDGLSYVVTTLTRHRPRPRSHQRQFSRSYPPETPNQTPTAEEQVFFEQPTTLPPSSPQLVEGGGNGGVVGPVGDSVDRPAPQTHSYRAPIARGWRRDHQDQDVMLRHHDIGGGRDGIGGIRSGFSGGGTRIFPTTLDHVLDNSNRRQYGMGWIGRVFGRSLRNSIQHDRKIREQLDDLEDHRPMFTYWVTIVQILVLCISLICYGFGPYGVDLHSRSGQVLVTSLSLQQVDIMEPANFWFGPNAADLIHLGAKFAPCMRVDDKITQEVDKIRLKERETACCIRNDDSGCVQSSQADCSKTISKWKKWKTGDAGPGGRISGSVCGLDPKFCDAPASVHPYEWPDDITKWPICRKKFSLFSMQKGQQHQSTKLAEAEHMVCEVIGHPCCIGIHGQCKITTREYCDFVRGTFHEEASLCSQVSCLNDVCGMLPFYFPDTPDQFYRLWTSLFLHAGVLQLIITILIQYFLMRDLEKLTGSLRIGIIYIGSGVAGNLASAIFVPYRADVGPAGSQFGLLACLIVEVLNAWPMLKHPNQALFKLLTILIFLFLLGLLPWVDNYAHLFGFIFGFLLSYALLPFITFGKYDRQKKIFLVWVCLLISVILFVILILLFYIIPVYDCKICSYFNCIPFTRDFCASQNINFKREEPIV